MSYFVILKLSMKNNIVVFAAHPDDEALGCSGSLALHSLNKDNIFVVFMTDGVSSRHSNNNKRNVNKRKINCLSSLKTLNIKEQNIYFLNFPDNQLDTVPLLKIVKEVEKIINKCNPCIVYTHFKNDLNIDHKITYEAVMTACRPLPNSTIEKILLFEVLSSTDWSLNNNSPFQPNFFVDITKSFKKKINAIKKYENEIKKKPHSRSLNNVKNLAIYRGSSVGVNYAEAFMVERIIKK